MLSIIRNDWHRMREQKAYLFVALGLTICSVILAVVLTSKLEPAINLAVVGEAPVTMEREGLNVTELTQAPELSALVQGEYDAVLIFDGKGTYEITTVKSGEFREKLEAVLAGKTQAAGNIDKIRKIGTNILGYMLMFLLMQGVLYGRLFAEDKEKHQLERIVCAPLSFWKYLTGHVIFMWELIFLPAMLVILVLDLLGVAVGFALWQYVLLIGLLALVSTCFAVCLNSFFCGADTANMTGSCIVVLTSVLSGTFYDMGSVDGWLSKIMYVMPQKNLMAFVDAWEKHSLDRGSLGSLFYVIICAVVFLGIGVRKTRNDYVKVQR